MKILSLILLLVLSLLTLCNASAPVPPPAPPQFFEILHQFFLPAGLFPDSVKNYTLHDDGHFELYLEKPCYLNVDYLIYYREKITGRLSLGSITNLKGVMMRVFYIVWLDLYGMNIDIPPTDKIYFSAGVFNMDLEMYKYFTIRACSDSAPVLEIPAAVDGSSSSVFSV